MPQFPFPSSREPEKKPEATPPKPTFIYVENQRMAQAALEDETRSEGKENPFEALDQLKKVHFPLFLRIVCFFLALFCLIWAGGALLCTIGLGLMHLITFTVSSELKRYLATYWDMTKKAMIYFAGLVICIFSPILGAGFLLLSTFLRGETATFNAFFSKFGEKSL